ncbi:MULTISPECIES: hypothetical protein [unclassified Meiothermus]|uniref:hypothetical protein n=1 Tax=unclassified Meiothermus TaxID=370471 RepID=UPI00101F7FE8|nr:MULTISPECIES: hypothetical protein [unclassified Meiothermus]RYM37172.1 hypothetical protein EWH23_06765 [Meiothermus sp. PNK-Is4]
MWWLSAESASVNPVEAIRQLQIWRYRELCGKEPDAGLQDRYGRDAFAILRWLKIKRRRYSWLLDFVSWSNENDFWSGREPSKDGRRYKSWPYLLQLLHTQAVEQFDRASSQAPGPAMSEAMERQRARLKEQARSYQPGQMFRTPEGQYARVDRIAGQWIILDVGSLDEIGNPIGKGHRERAVTADDLARMTPVDGVLDR